MCDHYDSYFPEQANRLNDGIKTKTVEKDVYAATLYARVKEMDTKDKTGMSFVDVYRPYSDLYIYLMFKIQSMVEGEKTKFLEENGLKEFI